MNFRRIYSSPHSRNQKILFSMEFAYNLFNLYFTWFSLANFYLSFYFLFDKLTLDGDPSVDPFHPNGYAVFGALKSLYVGSLVAMFITALGNRPQGSKWLYYLISIIFSVIMVLMLFMGGWTIKVQLADFNANSSKFSSSFAYAASTPAFRDLVLSVLATYGLYLISSILHNDPWHCFSSMIQYLLILPTYNNIFMIYSFCNLHDVSWGTKGATTMDVAPVVTTKAADGRELFVFDALTDQDDINEDWHLKVKKLKEYASNPVIESQGELSKEDGSKEFRTTIVLSWIFSNLVLVVIFTNDYSLQSFNTGKQNVNPYLTFLFWSVAYISLVRAIGSGVYMYQYYGEKLSDDGGRIRTIVV